MNIPVLEFSLLAWSSLLSIFLYIGNRSVVTDWISCYTDWSNTDSNQILENKE